MCLGTAATVVEVRESAGLVMADVEFPRGARQACLSYLADIAPGEHVLVAGGAIVERVSAEEACERASFAAVLLEAFEATHEPKGTLP